MKNELYELAKTLYEAEDPWDSCDYTIEDVLNDLENDPISVIKHLVERYIE